MNVSNKKSKTKTYRECVYIDGRPYFSPRFNRKSDAVAWKSKKLMERAEYHATGIRPKEKVDFHAINFKEYAIHWLENRVKVRSSIRTYEHYRSVLKVHLLPFFGSKPMDSITIFDVDTLTAKLQKNGHNAKGINVIFGVLRGIVNSALRDDLLEKDPLRHYRALKEPPRGDVFLTKEEIQLLLDANRNEECFGTLLLALNTGMRKGELAGLCWDSINFDNRLLEIKRSRDIHGLVDRLKTFSSRRYVPMNSILYLYLSELKKNASGDLILVNKKGEPISSHHTYRWFKEALVRAGIDKKIRFHDLRHTYASQFMMNGGNLYDLQKILGHTDSKMTQRYAHLAPEHLVNVANIVSFNSSALEIDFKKV